MASPSAAAAPRRDPGGRPVPAALFAPAASGPAASGSGSGPASDVHPVPRRAAAPPAALDLLAKARAGLAEAATLDRPHERYAAAHLAALRAAAAVLAARARPLPGPRRRQPIRSAWELLAGLAPELTEWSALFASGAGRRARAEAGITSAATPREADDLLRDAAHFLRLVERLLALKPVPPRRTGTDETDG
ncbi:SAV_6107 family HEPN domain-containing protein [Streptomyces exfoliatus]|uniref:SAV_6107 family HEPN domain-containing protein n=1 Tax=Streptomyces exfoliatus TaxID=1905 RepID=UPI0004C81FC2|nr:SAV_6107 family HEPN domain-containing protein [Streptomyces exfoliatus]